MTTWHVTTVIRARTRWSESRRQSRIGGATVRERERHVAGAIGVPPLSHTDIRVFSGASSAYSRVLVPLQPRPSAEHGKGMFASSKDSIQSSQRSDDRRRLSMAAIFATPYRSVPFSCCSYFLRRNSMLPALQAGLRSDNASRATRGSLIRLVWPVITAQFVFLFPSFVARLLSRAFASSIIATEEGQVTVHR